jgi:hypothetical protein
MRSSRVVPQRVGVPKHRYACVFQDDPTGRFGASGFADQKSPDQTAIDLSRRPGLRERTDGGVDQLGKWIAVRGRVTQDIAAPLP